MRTTTLVLLALLCLNAQARLGETLDECLTRYGQPLKQSANNQVLLWIKSHIEITAYMREGRCERIEYQKIKRRDDVLTEKFSEAEVTQLQEVNAPGKKWMSKFDLIDDQAATTDNSAWMIYKSLERKITFKTQALLDRELKELADAMAKKAAEEAAAAKKKLEGF